MSYLVDLCRSLVGVTRRGGSGAGGTGGGMSFGDVGEDGTWRLRLNEFAHVLKLASRVPEGVEGTLQRRLDELPYTARQVRGGVFGGSVLARWGGFGGSGGGCRGRDSGVGGDGEGGGGGGVIRAGGGVGRGWGGGGGDRIVVVVVVVLFIFSPVASLPLHSNSSVKYVALVF